MKKSKLSNITKLGVVVGVTAVFALSAPLVQDIFANTSTANSNTQSTTNADMRDLRGRITTRNIPLRAGTVGITFTGHLPHISVPRVGFAQQTAALNERFITQFDDFLNTHRTRATAIDVSMETFVSHCEQYLSVVTTMRAIGVNTVETAATTVINVSTLEIMQLNEIIPGGVRLVRNELNSRISLNPRLFATNITFTNTSPFYLDGDILIVPHTSGTFMLAHRTVFPSSFPRDGFEFRTLTPNHFITLPPEQYNVVMVQITPAIDEFAGYTTSWDGATNTLTIMRNGNVVSTLTTGVNSYFYGDADDVRTLELAPRLDGGSPQRLLVPISFLRDVLGMSTTTTPDGIIISNFTTPFGNANEQESTNTGRDTNTPE
ncbi:MAG: copper amine oxidase N-terminal domain-containing protein [Defluviitaleaceae bacterium]|nr:copper amine oxidase N-terminal domain-containing protein [Defluviitaleaceae bacterium]